MTEDGDTFAGTAARSTEHSAREDDALAHEVEGMIRSGRSTHAEEWNDPEPTAEGDPDVDSAPADTLTGGVPVVHDAGRGRGPGRAGSLAGPRGLPQHRPRAGRGLPGPPRARRRHRRAGAAARGPGVRADRGVVRALGHPTET